jgi:hypothetical protein
VRVEITAKSFFALMQSFSQPVTFVAKVVDHNLLVMEIKSEGFAPVLTVINSLMNDCTVVTTYYLEIDMEEARSEVGQPWRSDEEIVKQTEEVAALLLSRFHRGQLEDSKTFRHSLSHKVQECWNVACTIQEILTATDVSNAVHGVDD